MSYQRQTVGEDTWPTPTEGYTMVAMPPLSSASSWQAVMPEWLHIGEWLQVVGE